MNDASRIIATKVMGWHLCPYTGHKNGNVWANEDVLMMDEEQYDPTTNLQQAVEALEKFCLDMGTNFKITYSLLTNWDAGFYIRGNLCSFNERTLPLAICKALLAAVGQAEKGGEG